jgi:hypothetical protein
VNLRARSRGKRQRPKIHLDHIEDAGFVGAMYALYPEAVPIHKKPSIFDAA